MSNTELKVGDVIKVSDMEEKYQFAVVCYVYKDGSFSALVPDGFIALAERTRWEPTGEFIDMDFIYDRLKRMQEESEDGEK